MPPLSTDVAASHTLTVGGENRREIKAPMIPPMNGYDRIAVALSFAEASKGMSKFLTY